MMTIPPSPNNRESIALRIRELFTDVERSILTIKNAAYTSPPEPEKWSPAEHFEHLYLSAKPLVQVLNKPKIIFRAFGKPFQPSGDYDNVVERYKLSLQQGGKATGKYIPKMIRSKAELMFKWQRQKNKLSKIIRNSWTEAELDAYLLPHPLMGKLTVREMLFFTIYHTSYHHKIIQSICQT